MSVKVVHPLMMPDAIEQHIHAANRMIAFHFISLLS
jgi:hypothetical protein